VVLGEGANAILGGFISIIELIWGVLGETYDVP
jgi:hypothetical protein